MLADKNEEFPHDDEHDCPLLRLVDAIAKNTTSYIVEHYKALRDAGGDEEEDFVYGRGEWYEVTHTALTWLLLRGESSPTTDNYERIASLIAPRSCVRVLGGASTRKWTKSRRFAVVTTCHRV